jgi:NADPH-dependent 2,4-dienoyl-CoA reductase/sulfur reductase-like enzyme
MRLVIIGGSDAGISAALRARELDRAVEVHMILADAYPNFSICGLPFYLSGEISDWQTLAHRSCEAIEATGITLHLNEAATSIDVNAKRVITRSAGGESRHHAYDRLVIATGAVPVKPRVEGMGLPNVFVLHTMDECFALHRRLEASPGSAVIVGGGYIGLEMADALRHRDVAVTLIEQLPAVMRTIDLAMAGRVEALLRENGVIVRTNTTVTSIVETNGHLSVRCADGSASDGDFVLMVVGVRPLSELARACGIHTNGRGAIQVDRGMRTNLPEIFAAGDCVATWHRVLGRDLYMPLGTTSHKQGRVAGENAVDGACSFAGSLGTQSVKLFDRVVAGTGLREEDARSYGFEPLAFEITTYDHKVYYPGATEMIVRIVGDAPSGKLLGCQIFGSYGKEISKRIDTVATALHHRMSVEDLNELDLSYTPPLSSPWDPIQMAAQAWKAAQCGRRS